MKLVSYTPSVPKTAGGSARVDGGDAKAMANVGRMQGQALQGIANAIQLAGENVDAVNAQAAANEYTKRVNELLYNQDTGLLNTKMDGANGITGTFEEQVNGAFDQMESRLALFGLTLENVVQMDCLFRDVWNIPVMEKVIRERFHGKYPVRKSIQTEFAHVGGKDGLQFQADAVAYCG